MSDPKASINKIGDRLVGNPVILKEDLKLALELAIIHLIDEDSYHSNKLPSFGRVLQDIKDGKEIRVV